MSVAATPGGEKLNLTGTIEEIHAQLLEINPNFDEDFGVKADAEPLVGRSLGKRFGPSCGGGSFNWGSADPGRIQEGINYLRGIAGQPYLGPGPGVCSRPSCSYNSAIWWCNDKRDIAVLPGFNTIADCAQVLKNACTIDGRTVGQNFVSLFILPHRMTTSLRRLISLTYYHRTEVTGIVSFEVIAARARERQGLDLSSIFHWF